MPQKMESSDIDWDQIDPAATFKNKTFVKADFSGRMLVGVDFSGSIFRECNFNACDLSHANFEGSDLYRSTFRSSVLYSARFSECNLTRCDFEESFIYGLRIEEFSNITYAKFGNFQLEARRRSSQMLVRPGDIAEMKAGKWIGDPTQLSRRPYASNGYLFNFEKFDRAERHMQRSQVFNRLKRLYLANGFNEEARYSLYRERRHRTRSWYLHHSFAAEQAAGGDFRNTFRRIALTVTAYIFEQLAGYGLRPRVVLRNLFAVYFFYVIVVMFMLHQKSSAGILFTTLEVKKTAGAIVPIQHFADLQFSDVGKVLYFCAYSMFSLTFQNFSPYGDMAWLSSCFGLAGLSLLALLISAVFSVLRTD